METPITSNSCNLTNYYDWQKKEEMERFKEQGVELEVQRQSILKDLEEKQTDASKYADDFNEKYTGVMKIIDQLRAGKLKVMKFVVSTLRAGGLRNIDQLSAAM